MSIEPQLTFGYSDTDLNTSIQELTENTELDTLQFFRFGAADSYDNFERGTSSKTSSFAGVAGGSFTLIGSVGSWQSEFKVVTFCRAKLQS